MPSLYTVPQFNSYISVKSYWCAILIVIWYVGMFFMHLKHIYNQHWWCLQVGANNDVPKWGGKLICDFYRYRTNIRILNIFAKTPSARFEATHKNGSSSWQLLVENIENGHYWKIAIWGNTKKGLMRDFFGIMNIRTCECTHVWMCT